MRFPPLDMAERHDAGAPVLHGRPAGVGGKHRDWQERGVTLSTVVDYPTKAAHGRYERRALWALADPWQAARIGDAGHAGRPWPHAQQLCRIERRRTHQQTGVTNLEVSYAITSLSPTKADAARLLALVRDYWSIENRLHHVRDVTFDEDRCQTRCGAAPQVMAVCRNLTIALLHRVGIATIAQYLRTHAARPRAAATLVLGYYLE